MCEPDIWATPPLRTSEQTAPPGPFSPRQNHLLAALTEAELEPLLPHMTLTGLAPGTVLYEPGSKMDDVYFPVSGVVSLLYTLEDGHTTDLAGPRNRAAAASAAPAMHGPEQN